MTGLGLVSDLGIQHVVSGNEGKTKGKGKPNKHAIWLNVLCLHLLKFPSLTSKKQRNNKCVKSI